MDYKGVSNMITIKADKNYDKNYEVEYTIYKNGEAYVSKVLIVNPDEYYKLLNKLVEAQLEDLKKRI